MQSASTVCTATALFRNMRPDGSEPARRSLRFEGNRSGIKVGTSIALLSRSGIDSDTPERGKRILYRDFHQARPMKDGTRC